MKVAALHVDPQKEANAQATRLASNTTTLAAEYAKAGLDWESELRQRAREAALLRELGLVSADASAPPPEPDSEFQEEEDVTDDVDACAAR